MKDTKKETAFVVKILPLKSIKLWKDNPRKNEKSSEKLAELLKKHGVRTPVVVWKKDMTIYKGNTTFKACKLAGIKTIPVILADFTSKSAAVAYALADNKASEWAEWDDQILKQLLESKEMVNLDLAVHTGFSEKELNAFKALEVHAMDEIADVDLQGETEDTGNFMVIRFGSKKVYDKVSTALGLTKGKRVIEWDTIKERVDV